MIQQGETALPLRDFIVLDLSQIIAGPETAMLLGDLGADVIKIEKPGGDDSRYMGVHRQSEPMTLTYSVLNRNKRSIVLDITRPEGLDVLYRLVKKADILVEAFVPGTTERLRIDYETLKEVNPRLIYASISGFGTHGPYASKPAYDLVVQGFSGVMAARRWPDGTPIPAPFWVGDASAPFIIGFGIMLAAWSRERTGVGQMVATSLLQAHIAMQSTQLVKAKQDADTESTGSAAFMPYPCGDGEYIRYRTGRGDGVSARIFDLRGQRPPFCAAVGRAHRDGADRFRIRCGGDRPAARQGDRCLMAVADG
ncbi:MAG: CoA transferase [Chloroflexi bacterium]|nr:CoA transferase [Chloroflexota bacterium]